MSDTQEVTAAPVAADPKIICHIDNVRVHSIQSHITKNHSPSWTVDRYQKEFPGEPLLSQTAIQMIAERTKTREENAAKEKASSVMSVSGDVTGPSTLKSNLAAFHEVFGLGAATAARNGAGNAINISVMSDHDEMSLSFMPEIDPNYVFNIDLVKKVIIAFELNMTAYLWGFHGTGKTTVLQQAAARTRRPLIRIQHTQNMQESEVLGQWTVKDGSTIFQLGPLPLAMINGWVYCADEYDYAMPAVSALYQPVMEGQSLLIKDAPPQFRKIQPHPQFRFVATGNTNGVGDETGLYQGTLVQNAANYSRFAMTEEVKYMDAKIEVQILVAQAGIDRADAVKIVKFANDIREMFRNGKISMTVSPRELINAGKLGVAYGKQWALGLELAFANRLSRIDQEVAKQYLQRIFS